jgi:hypothetical protein
MTKLASTRMDLLAVGMGVDPPPIEGEDDGTAVGMEYLMCLDERKTVITPGSAEEWIARQGYEGMLHC